MSWLGRKGPYDIDSSALDRGTRRTTRQVPTKQSKRLALLLVLHMLAAIFVYFGCISLGFSPIFFIYMGGAAVMLLIYVIYNRGFVLRGATPEMLSDEYSLSQKQQMLDEAARRMRDSRWMLTVIIPLVVALLLDVVYLFLLEDLLLSLGIQLG